MFVGESRFVSDTKENGDKIVSYVSTAGLNGPPHLYAYVEKVGFL